METETTGLVNTIKVAAQGGDMDYATCPAGKRLMGLVNVTNCKIRPFKPGDPEEDGYQFTFRDKEVTNAFINVRVAAKTGNDRANLVRLMKSLTDGAVMEKAKPDEMFTAIQLCMNAWYQVRVVHRQGKDKHGEQRTYANIDDFRADPATVDLPPPSEYFSEAMESHGGEENGHAPSSKVYYSLATLSDDTRAKAIVLLKKAGATPCNAGDVYWESPVAIDKLQRLVCSAELALDDVPF